MKDKSDSHSSTCILCKEDSSQSRGREHIMPEGMGCAPGLILEPGIVCDQCNNRMSVLDEELQRLLGMFKVLSVPTSKKGRPTRAFFRNAFMEYTETGPVCHLNGEKHAIRLPNGQHLAPARPQDPRSLEVTSFSTNGPIGTLKFRQTFDVNDKVKRELHKIALEFMCKVKGPVFVLDEKYDSIRDYVLNGKGSRYVILCASKERFTGIKSRWTDPEGRIIVVINFFAPSITPAIQFLVSLSHDMFRLNMLFEKSQEMYGSGVLLKT